MSSMVGISDVEIIEFKHSDESRTLYVSNILTNDMDSEQIKGHLDTIFSEYGILCTIIVTESQFADDGKNSQMKNYYALVMFFSRQAALTAYQDMRDAGLQIDDGCSDSRAKVRFARKRVGKSVPLDQTLYLPRCYLLANHYLGFNGWSSDIVSLEACPSEPGFVEFICVVRITVHDDVPLISEGVGSAKETYETRNPISRLSSHCKARKLSHQRAAMAAFSRILLVVTSNGKVYAEVDSTNAQTNDHLTLQQSDLIQNGSTTGEGDDTECQKDGQETSRTNDSDFRITSKNMDRNVLREYQKRLKEIAGKKKKDYIKEELNRLENNLQREYSKVKKPEVREHFPYIYTSPYPYCNTEVARYVIRMPEDEREGRSYKSRSTAIGLCDPVVDHRMDTTSAYDLVRLPNVKRNGTSTRNTPRDGEPEKGSEKRPPKEGSTRLPKFPAVTVDSKDLTTKTLYYNDVPMLRQQLREKYLQNSEKRINQDYTRTRDDFYRMELDRFDQLHPHSRPLMRKCYFAYLQNTRGSKKAIYECLKTKNEPTK